MFFLSYSSTDSKEKPDHAFHTLLENSLRKIFNFNQAKTLLFTKLFNMIHLSFLPLITRIILPPVSNLMFFISI